MKRGNIVILVFILVAAAALAINYYLVSRPPLEVQVAVNPLAADWVRQTVSDFNATNPVIPEGRRVVITIVTVDDLDVIEGTANWTPESHPAMWLATTTAAVDYADPRYPLQVEVDSVARTPLVWGGFTDRVDVLPALDWASVADAAQQESWAAIGGDASWQFIKLAYPAPNNSMSGIAVLFSGAANYHNSSALTPGDLGSGEFREWFAPIARSVPNFNTLGSNPAQAMAQRGASVADLAILPESQWLMSLDSFRGGIRLSYPQQQVILDFPLVRWQDVNEPEQASAVGVFADWLTRDDTQESLLTYGLRPANTAPTDEARLFADGVAVGIQYEPDFSQRVQPPDRSAMLSLLTWYNQIR